MTHNQTQQWRKLQAKVEQTYKAFQANTDKSKHNTLAKAWQDSIVKEERFTAKFN
jgi:hypothetical protein